MRESPSWGSLPPKTISLFGGWVCGVGYGGESSAESNGRSWLIWTVVATYGSKVKGVNARQYEG